MKKTSLYHVTWYIAIALAIVLAATRDGYWYVPIVAYFGGAIASIVIISAFRGNIIKLPHYARKAFKMIVHK